MAVSLQQAIAAHARGDIGGAANLYRKLLRRIPDNAHALHWLGVIEAQSGRLDAALELLEKAARIHPDDAALRNSLGNALRDAGRIAEALPHYEQALRLNPQHAGIWSNRGAVLNELGRNAEALSSYEQALALQPEDATALFNRGNVLRDLNRLDEAEESHRRALCAWPDYLDAQEGLAGIVVSKLAASAVKESVRSLEMFCRREYGAPDDPPGAAAPGLNGGIAAFRLKHDVQQAEYLRSGGHAVADLDDFLAAGRAVLARAAPGSDGSEKLAVSGDEMHAIADFRRKPLLYPMPQLRSCLNPALDWAQLERDYHRTYPEILYIDDFLTSEALRAFREFCLVSRIWTGEYANKYLGAFGPRGFVSPLHLQLAEELKRAMPAVFKDYALDQMWAFKYDATLGKGINVHADFARVNLNFWLTPDQYNLDPTSGGLKIYDVPAPAHWTFRDYNANAAAIMAFLNEHKARCVTVPYRCNRAVLFNSALFHETDNIRFVEGYESRRINITYLFGQQLVSG